MAINMNIDLFRWPLLVLAGLSLGSAYFGGLWMTLQRLRRWRHPFLNIGLSFLVRLAILLGGGAWLLQHAIAPPLPTVLLLSVGVWLSRLLMTRLLVPIIDRP